jgi:hypothetical protein
MNEIIKDYIRQISCKIIINKLQKVLRYVIYWQMDEKTSWVKTLKVYHTWWKRHNLYYNPFLPYILIPIKNNESKFSKGL